MTVRQREDAVRSWLLRCATQRAWSGRGSLGLPPLRSTDRDRLLRAAQRHRLTGAVHLAARLQGEAEVAEGTLDGHEANVVRHLQGLAVVRDVAAALQGLRWALVKGPVLASVVYSRPDVRSYSDVDVLVRPRDLATALNRLEAAGFAPPEDDWEQVRLLRLGEVHLASAHGPPLDLHHDLVHHGERRDRFALDTSALLARAVELEVAGRLVPVLDPADALLHLCLHTSGSGGDRLCWFADVHHSVLCRPPDWDVLLQRAEQARLGIVSWLVLDTCARVLGTPVPAAVLAALRPAAPLRAIHTVALRLDPLERRTGVRSLGRLTARAASGSSAATLRLAVRQAVHRRATGSCEGAGAAPSAQQQAQARQHALALLAEAAQQEEARARTSS